MLAVPAPDAAIACYRHLSAHFDTNLSACELMNRAQIELALAHVSATKVPFAVVPPYAMLFDLSDSNPAKDFYEDAESCVMKLIDAGHAADAIICTNVREADALWHLRHSFPEANKLGGQAIMFDVSIRLVQLTAFLAAAEEAARASAPEGRPVFMGHLGDGNMHRNWMLPRRDGETVDQDQVSDIQNRINAVLDAQCSSFSAEHGIGRKHVDDLRQSLPAAEMDLLRSLKSVLDPKNLLSPGVVFDCA